MNCDILFNMKKNIQKVCIELKSDLIFNQNIRKIN